MTCGLRLQPPPYCVPDCESMHCMLSTNLQVLATYIENGWSPLIQTFRVQIKIKFQHYRVRY